MSLPVLQTDPNALLRAIDQTDGRFSEHLADVYPLEVGTAYASAKLDRVWDANNIREVALPRGTTAPAAFAQVEAFFAARGTRCAFWVMNRSATDLQSRPMVEYLLSRGYRAEVSDVLRLSQAPAASRAMPAGVTIIPARASYRHVRELAEESARRWKEPQLVERYVMHLDDPHWEVLLALADGKAAGQVGVLSYGEIGRIEQVYVAEGLRRRGIGSALMGAMLDLCSRALFKHVLLTTLADNGPAQALYRKFGFARIGEHTAYFAARTSAAR